MHIIRLIALCASQAAAATDKKSSPSTILAFRWSGFRRNTPLSGNVSAQLAGLLGRLERPSIVRSSLYLP